MVFWVNSWSNIHPCVGGLDELANVVCHLFTPPHLNCIVGWFKLLVIKPLPQDLVELGDTLNRLLDASINAMPAFGSCVGAMIGCAVNFSFVNFLLYILPPAFLCHNFGTF